MRTLFMAAAIAALTAGPAAAQSNDAAGKWNVTWNTGQGPLTGQLVVTKSGDKLTGKIVSDRGDISFEGTQTDKNVKFTFVYNDQSGPMNVEMIGTVDGDTMKGTFNAGNGAATGDWEGKRQASGGGTTATTTAPTTTTTTTTATTTTAAGGVTGTWNLTVQLPEMTATPTVNLKQDGEKLTGDYLSTQYGKFPLQGTVKGNDVAFAFTMTIEGNAVEVNYSGKVDKDQIKGTVNYGGMMSGTFTGTKKKQ